MQFIFDDDWFIVYRARLLASLDELVPGAERHSAMRKHHAVHNLLHGAGLDCRLDPHIENALKRLPSRHARAIRAHMQFYRACLVATGLVPADRIVRVGVQVEWFWYNTAILTAYRDHLAHVMKVAALSLFLLTAEESPLAVGGMPLIESVGAQMLRPSASPAIRAAARRCGVSESDLSSPLFWKAAVVESVRLAGLLHDMAHPAVLASRMWATAAPVRLQNLFEPDGLELCRQSVAHVGHRLLAAPFNGGELPSPDGLSWRNREVCARVFLYSHSMRAGYALLRLAEEADRVWQLSPFDAFVMEWAALGISMHEHHELLIRERLSLPDPFDGPDDPTPEWLADAQNIEALSPCFQRDPVSYILALADQIQDFGRVQSVNGLSNPSDDRIETRLRYPCKAVSLRIDEADKPARLQFQVDRSDLSCFGADAEEYTRIRQQKAQIEERVFARWLRHNDLGPREFKLSVVDVSAITRSSFPVSAPPPARKDVGPVLSFEDQERLAKALAHAYPSWEELEVLLAWGVKKKLEEITNRSSITYVVFKVIEDADAKGWIGDLVSAAKSRAPNNPLLQQFDLPS